MERFENLEELVETMMTFSIGDIDNYAVTIADKDITSELIKIILSNDNVKLSILEYDIYEYDGLYYIRLGYDEEDDMFNLSVECAMNKNEEIFGIDGYVFVPVEYKNVITSLKNHKACKPDIIEFVIGDKDCMDIKLIYDKEYEDMLIGFECNDGLFLSDNIDNIITIAKTLGYNI